MITQPFRNIAVVGAGLMGHGIALEFAAAGYPVKLHDVSEESLQRARENIAATLPRLAKLGILASPESSRVPDRIRYSTDLPEAVTSAELVIEAATEDLETKRRIFSELDRLCPAHTILASNSSSLVPSLYASVTRLPARILGVHYFNPPYLVPCVELVAGPETAEETVQSAREILTGLGKRVVVIRREIPGFIANRLQAALFREALSLVERGIATPEDIDAAVRYGIGRRYDAAGPFEIFDLAGLDTVLAAARHLGPSLESATTVSALLEARVARGDLGTKTGQGFYCWTPECIGAVRARIAEGLARQAQWDGALAGGRERFVGNWRLVSFESRTAEGEVTFPFGEDATGCLMYTAAGRMSVMLSKAGRAPFGTPDPMAVEVDEKAAAFESCIAYAGTYEVGEGRIIHRLEECTLPDWIGSEQVRFYRFEGDRLILETPPLPVRGRHAVSRLVWKR